MGRNLCFSLYNSCEFKSLLSFSAKLGTRHNHGMGRAASHLKAISVMIRTTLKNFSVPSVKKKPV